MRIVKVEIHGLFGRENPITWTLNSDINIITGKNGAGKTTAMKLAWYIISGNILEALREIKFARALIVTDLYECMVIRTGDLTCKVEMRFGGLDYVYEDQNDDGEFGTNAEDYANEVLRARGGSIFFPTFRRIEGGFTLELSRTRSSNLRGAKQPGDIEEDLLILSRKLTKKTHVFVAAISTSDIVRILLQRYAELSELSNVLQKEASQELIDTIKRFESNRYNENRTDAAYDVIEKIRLRIEEIEDKRMAIMAPLNAVQLLVKNLFMHAGIEISPRYSFGDAAGAINSDALSAGEKQLLSFVCYNGLHKDCVIFIDEPELSLHVDWQRRLFHILQSQQTHNQFIIATHSPFIYSKFPDKEISMDIDRGDAGEVE